jgi:hypothetical protein
MFLFFLFVWLNIRWLYDCWFSMIVWFSNKPTLFIPLSWVLCGFNFTQLYGCESIHLFLLICLIQFQIHLFDFRTNPQSSFLGLPIGANPKSESTWDPLVEQLRKRLFSWRNKFISLGGRIVLINSVLNAIPIFHLSFLKMLNKVLKKVVRIQREFLWGGVKGGRK